MEKLEERKDWIDTLRAIAVLFVIYGHMQHGIWGYYVFTSPIKIPLFFALSGYLFNEHNGNYKIFMKKILVRYAIPWLFLSFLPITILSFVKGFSWFRNSAENILTGESVWYMPCCMIAEIIYFTACKFIHKPTGRFVVAVISFFAGILLTRNEILDLFMINRALGVQIFIFAGYCMKLNTERSGTLKWRVLILASALYIGLCTLSLFIFPGQVLDVHHSWYYNIPYCLILIFLGLFVLFSIAPRLKTFPRFVVFIGRNTLVYYIWSSYVAGAFGLCLSFAGVTLPNNWFIAMIRLAVCCIGCGICAWILNKYVPGLVGKESKEK